MQAMGITDYNVYLAQPEFYRDDMLLVTEAREDARRSLEAEGKAKSKQRRGQRT
jgi:hypothetical protein